MQRLNALPGIGPWTAQYIAMRALSWPDAFLSTDLGVLKALGTTSSQRAEEMSHAWQPWRSYAVMHLWKKLGTLYHGGWGKISASATIQYAIDHIQPDLLVNLGTCGGFEGRIETGTIILVERTLVYDIIEQMSDGAAAIDHYASTLDLSWLSPNVPHPILRGLLVSADRDIIVEDISMLIEKYNAVAADWESGAIAWVAQKNKTRLLILRAVSDLVGGDGGGSLREYRAIP